MEGKQMTEKWKQLGFIVKESKDTFTVAKSQTKKKLNDEVIDLVGITFKSYPDKVLYDIVGLDLTDDLKQVIEQTVEWLEEKRDMIDVLGNEWKHLKNHGNKVFGK